jgi:hypothetical protein
MALVDPRRVERALAGLVRRRNITGASYFVDRSTGSHAVAVILAGYKPYLWDITLARLERFLSPEIDVCLVSPALRSGPLEALAERRGWSYLSTRANYVSLAQNLAIARHPDARWVVKLDEDIVIGEGFFERLLAAYGRVVAEGHYRPGFCAPVLNVNGFSYLRFLQTMGLEAAYRERFGDLRLATGEIPATNDGEAALWLWRHSLPFDEVAARFAAQPPAFSTVPHRFSIGAILFEREFWDSFGGLLVRPPAGALGVDEASICRKCVDMSRAMVVAHDVFAGHFSFSAQEAFMREHVEELRPELALPQPPAVPASS